MKKNTELVEKRWTFGGQGSHFDDCWKVHIDCALSLARMYLKDTITPPRGNHDGVVRFLEGTDPMYVESVINGD